MATTQDRVGTANIVFTLSSDEAEDVLKRVLRQGSPELLAVQEWDSSTPILDPQWRFVRPTVVPGPTGPFVVDIARYSPISCKAKVLVGEGFVGKLPGRKSILPPSVATLGVFEDNVLGGEVAAINVHLTAEVQDRFGDYHHDKAHRKRVKRHRKERRKLAALVRRQRRKGRRVYVCGDTNFDGMTLPPLVSCWHLRPGGTLGSRAVDIIFAPERATAVKTIPTKSDHHSVVATYERKKSV